MNSIVAEQFLSSEQYKNNKCITYINNNSVIQSFTYAEVSNLIINFADGCRYLSVGKKVGIYSKNCYQWFIIECGLQRFSAITVPLYDTLGDNAVEYIVEEANLETICCSIKEFNLVNQMRTVKTIILLDDDLDVNSYKEQSEKLVYTFSDVIEIGSSVKFAPVYPSMNDYYRICYTSGTTGNPKGVVITHENVANQISDINDYLNFTEKDRCYIFLPLQHCFGHIVMLLLMQVGGECVFGESLMDDIKICQPTIFPGVPRLYNKIYDSIHKVINGNKQVMDVVKTKMGFNNVRMAITGAAPLSAHVFKFYKQFFPVFIEGYGQTEAIAAVCLSDAHDLGAGNYTNFMRHLKYRLDAVPELGYNGLNAGELCIKGNVCQGYYKQPELTKELFDQDGWLHTGDICTIAEDGVLKIIDRRKNIFKVSNGEYIAVEKIENLYLQSTSVDQICIVGNSKDDTISAVVVPSNNMISEKQLFDDMKQYEVELKGFEKVKKIIISPEPFTVENNLLTPTFKVRRNEIMKRFLL